jgi:hypothetical protein
LLPRGDHIQCIVDARIVADPCLDEGVKAAQHVEVPPRWMVQASELGVDQLPSPLATMRAAGRRPWHIARYGMASLATTCCW